MPVLLAKNLPRNPPLLLRLTGRVLLQIAYREREVRAWAALAGFVGSAAAGKALKRLAAQRRPAARCALLGNCGSFGMPSSHAQSMAFAWALHLCQARGRMQPRQVRPRARAPCAAKPCL